MEARDMGRDGRRGDKKPPQGGTVLVGVHDWTSDHFEETWRKLRELHHKDLHHLQTKLINLSKERLKERRAVYKAKIKELTVYQRVFKTIIRDLRDRLKAKKCKRCMVNETQRNTLQQELYNIQQKSSKRIAKLTAQRNKLKEENKRLFAKLKKYQPYAYVSFTDNDDDSDSDTEIAMPSFSTCTVWRPVPGTRRHLAVKLVQQPNTEKMKSGEKEKVQHGSNSPTPFDGQDISEVPETSFETTSSNASQPASAGSAKQQSTTDNRSASTLAPQRGYGFQGVFHLPKDRVRRSKRKRTSTPEGKIQTDFFWSLSSISSGSPELSEENPVTLVSETSEEDMPRSYRRTCHPPPQKKPSLTASPFDSTLRSSGKRSMTGDTQHNIGFSVRDGSSQTPSSEQSTLKKNGDQSASAQCGADTPQRDPESFNVRSSVKKKAKTQSHGAKQRSRTSFLLQEDRLSFNLDCVTDNL